MSGSAAARSRGGLAEGLSSVRVCRKKDALLNLPLSPSTPTLRVRAACEYGGAHCRGELFTAREGCRRIREGCNGRRPGSQVVSSWLIVTWTRQQMPLPLITAIALTASGEAAVPEDEYAALPGVG